MRALNGDLIPQKKREGRVVKIMLNNSRPAVDKGAPTSGIIGMYIQTLDPFVTPKLFKIFPNLHTFMCKSA